MRNTFLIILINNLKISLQITCHKSLLHSLSKTLNFQVPALPKPRYLQVQRIALSTRKPRIILQTNLPKQKVIFSPTIRKFNENKSPKTVSSISTPNTTNTIPSTTLLQINPYSKKSPKIIAKNTSKQSTRLWLIR